LVRVSVPATSANLGPGFDTFGLALELRNTLALEEAAAPEVHFTGEGAEVLGREASNLVLEAVAALYRQVGRPTPTLRLRVESRVPLARGLGSSATAIVGGLVAARALAGVPLSDTELFQLADRIEGHPDNVAPALWGGAVLAWRSGQRVHARRLGVPPQLAAAVAVPETAVPTERSRAVLPATVPLADAVFNLGRSALLATALLTGELELLRDATQDRLHQPYRAALVPGLEEVLAAARGAGALGAALSGSGSAVLALGRGDLTAVAAGMADAFRAAGVGCRTWCLEVSREGARVEEAG
jgi:homoserine kinase